MNPEQRIPDQEHDFDYGKSDADARLRQDLAKQQRIRRMSEKADEHVGLRSKEQLTPLKEAGNNSDIDSLEKILALREKNKLANEVAKSQSRRPRRKKTA